jgi:hypothetical protein
MEARRQRRGGGEDPVVSVRIGVGETRESPRNRFRRKVLPFHDFCRESRAYSLQPPTEAWMALVSVLFLMQTCAIGPLEV